MGDILIDLAPLILRATLVPLYPVVALLMLQSQDGLRKAVAFVSGAVAVRLIQGIIFGLVFHTATETYPEYGPALIASTLLLVVGILLLVAAYKKWRNQADPDDPPPQWMQGVGALSAFRALGAGALLVAISVKQWVFTLAAIDVIVGATVGAGPSVGAYLIYTLATQVLVLLPILASALAPQQSAKPLQAVQAWLERNTRVITITVSLVFGLYFSYKGISGLLG